jgi:hypothetical protein
MCARVIHAFDVGTTLSRPPKFAWARRNRPGSGRTIGGRDITQLVEHISDDARRGRSVALGIEAPCFIPVPCDAKELSRKRTGENDRAWSAPPGAYVTTLGLHQVAWVLRSLRAEFGRTHLFTADWSLWPGSNRPILLLWEAFVSRTAHSDDDIQDAATAVNAFCRNERRLGEINDVTCSLPICIAHAAALWSGWSSDVSGLHTAMLVVRPNEVWRRAIQRIDERRTVE